MKKRIIIIFIILVLILIPIITLANIKLKKIDDKGRTIVYSSEDMKDLEDGTPISLAIPVNETSNEVKKDYDSLMKQKNEDLKESKSKEMTRRGKRRINK